MAAPRRLTQLGWFILLWCAGVAAVTAVGFLIRLVLM
ncbi:DUF2474 domain-containing protein [Agaricicola taiwanensis]|nr:DUF2474 domain-containing protein [Agaricicola taiwanensis]